MKINKLIEKFDVIRSNHRRSSYYYSSDAEDASGRSKLWRFTTSYRETLSPTFSSDNSLLFRRDRLLSCVKFTPAKKSRNMVRVLVGKERQAFQVEPQILDHGVVQCLVEKSMENRGGGALQEEYFSRLRAGESPLFEEEIFLDCDAILFEHILWLLSNDDPSLRNLNLDELMEFYT